MNLFYTIVLGYACVFLFLFWFALSLNGDVMCLLFLHLGFHIEVKTLNLGDFSWVIYLCLFEVQGVVKVDTKYFQKIVD